MIASTFLWAQVPPSQSFNLGDVVGTNSPPNKESTQQQVLNAITQITGGTVSVTQGTVPWIVDGSGVTQPISAVSLPLPTGAATDASLTTINTTLGSPMQQTGGSLSVTNFPATQAVTQSTSPWVVDASGFPVPVTQSGSWTTGRTWNLASPGDSVSAVQSGTWTTGRSWSLSSGSDSVSALISNFPALQAVNLTELAGASFSALNSLPVQITNGTSFVDPTQIRLLTSADQITALQGGSWTVTANAGTGTFQTNVTNSSIAVTQSTSPWVVNGSGFTQPISAVSLPLPTGASTSANQTNGNQKTQIVDGSNTVVGPFASFGSGINYFQVHTSSGSSVTGGGAADTAELVAGVYQSSPLSLISGQQAALQIDSSGNLKTTATVTIPGTVSVTQGTSPWVVSGTVTANQGSPPWSVSQSGTWNINNISGTISLPTGAATNSELITINSTLGSPMQQTGGTVTANQGGAPWSVSQSGSWTVTANAGTNLNTSALALDTSVNGILLSQGSTTASQKGPLTQGAVSTSAPSYTNAQTSPLSLTTSGALRTDSSSTTQPVSGTVTANQGGTWNVNNVSGTVSLPTGASTSANQTNGNQKTQVVDGSGNVWGPVLTLSGTNYQPVVQASSGTPGSAVPARNTVIAGSDGTNAQTLSTDTTGKLNINNISGTISLPTGASTASGQSATQPRNITQFGGTNISTGTGASGTGIPRVTVANDSNILATQSGTWTVQQGSTATALVDAWPVKPTDGTNAVTFKASSTAAATTDTAEVMTISPNSTTASGNSYRHIAGAATTTVKSGAGHLHAIIVNATGNSTTITVYDNTAGSGTEIAAIGTTPGTLTYDIAFSTGLTLVTTNAATDVTVSYQFIILIFLLPRGRKYEANLAAA